LILNVVPANAGTPHRRSSATACDVRHKPDDGWLAARRRGARVAATRAVGNPSLPAINVVAADAHAPQFAPRSARAKAVPTREQDNKVTLSDGANHTTAGRRLGPTREPLNDASASMPRSAARSRLRRTDHASHHRCRR